MARVRICSGVCGFCTAVETAATDMMRVEVRIESDCPHCTTLAAELQAVNPFQELKPDQPGGILDVAKKHLPHAACPVPPGIVKAVEVAAGLALPRDATITFED